MDLTAEFIDWVRVPTTATGFHGRALSSAAITVDVVTNASNPDAAATAPATASFAFPGPGDVQGLLAGAVRRAYPSPGAVGAEAQRSAYVELAAADLPWRYAPQGATAWLAVLGGADGAELRLSDDGSEVAIVDPALFEFVALSAGAGAHVQRTPGDRATEIARIVCPRALPASASCLAVVVPAFSPDGIAWPPGTTALPVYFDWRFTTGDDDVFLTIAARLRHRKVPGLGSALVTAPVTAPGAAEETVSLPLHAALRPLAAISIGDAPQAVADAIIELSRQPQTPARPVLGAPDYVAAWPGDVSVGFRRQLAVDPRDRGAAGLGAGDGIRNQEPLVRAMLAQAGDHRLAAGRVAALSGGLVAARTAWRRRMPADELDRLAALGPALPGMMLDAGPDAAATRSVADAVTGADALPAGAVSSAARRMLRSRRASVREPAPAAVLEALLSRPLNRDVTPFPPGFYDEPAIQDAVAGMAAPDAAVASPEDLPATRLLGPDEMRGIAVGTAVLFDPSGAAAPQLSRVGATIVGITPDQLTRPVEVCESLDLATWTYLRDTHPEFLLHGIDELPADTLIALQVDDRFVEAYLLGLNTQLIAELRYRGVAVAAGCTPLRRFWARAVATGPGGTAERDDIPDVSQWSPATAPLGDHHAHGADQLVMLFRTVLFHRYPATRVSLRRAGDATRLWPTFGGAVDQNVVFFGFDLATPKGGSLDGLELVLEDPPHITQFRTAKPTPTTRSSQWASDNIVRPVQIILDGDYVDGEL